MKQLLLDFREIWTFSISYIHFFHGGMGIIVDISQHLYKLRKFCINLSCAFYMVHNHLTSL